jgi:hypothetical protein
MKRFFIFFMLVMALCLVQLPLQAHAKYRLNGILDIQKQGEVTFNCEDGRIFNLKISAKKAARYDGELVQIDAYAEDGMNLDELKVTRIREYEKRIMPSDAPYDELRRFSRILDAKGPNYIVKDVRWATKKANGDNPAEHFWQTVKINTDLIDKAYFVLKPFPPEWLAAHALLLFTFKDGGFIDKDGNKSVGLVLTIEAYLRTDQKYDLAKGLKNRFGIIWQLATWENYAALNCDKPKGKLVAHEILLPQHKIKALLKDSLSHAVKNREGEFYHTTRNNCTNNLVLLLNQQSDKKIKPWTIPSVIYNLRATMPVMVPKRLNKLGIIGEKLPEVNQSNFFARPQEIFYPKYK